MNLRGTLLAAAWSLALAASCSDPPRPVTMGPQAAPNPGPAEPAPMTTGCRLPAPVKSDDPCSSDADCGVSEPCHAHACVAKAKSKPRTPETICTMVMDCQSADVNRCGCLEGRCALIPPP